MQVLMTEVIKSCRGYGAGALRIAYSAADGGRLAAFAATDGNRTDSDELRMGNGRRRLGHGWDADSNRPASDDGRIQITETKKITFI